MTTPQAAADTRASETSPDSPPGGGALVAVLAAAGILAALMQTLVIPLIGDLPKLLDSTPSSTSWVITATLLTGAVATPVVGRLGDRFGKKRVMLYCIVPLVAGSIVGALATSVWPMIIGRGLQGLGVGIIPLGISALKDVLPPQKLHSSIAIMSSSMGIGGALGLPLAAGVVQWTSWRVLFWGVAVLAVLVGALIWKFVPFIEPRPAAERFDVVGAIGLGITLVCLLLAVSKGADWGWNSVTTLSLFAAAVIVVLVWGVWELRLAEPLVDLRVSARAPVLLTNLASVVIGFGMYAQSLILPQLMQLPTVTGYGLGQSMLAMGVWMAPSGLVMMAVSPIGGKLSQARGPKTTLIVGALIIAAGYGAAMGLMHSPWQLMLVAMICSAGVGFAYGAMPALIMSSVPLTETASATSVNTLMRSVGTSVSAAVVGVVLAQMSTTLGGHTIPTENGFRVGLLIGCGVAVLAALIAAFIPSRTQPVHLEVMPKESAPATVPAAAEIAVAEAAVTVAAPAPTMPSPAPNTPELAELRASNRAMADELAALRTDYRAMTGRTRLQRDGITDPTAFRVTAGTVPGPRAGTLVTPHGEIATPAFVPFAASGTVVGLLPETVRDLGAQAVLIGADALAVQPGADVVERAGGLGRFMNWSGATATVLSEPTGDPEDAVELQHRLGADLLTVPALPRDAGESDDDAARRTVAHARRALAEHAWQSAQRGGRSSLWALVPGGRGAAHAESVARALREVHEEDVRSGGLGFGGYAVDDPQGLGSDGAGLARIAAALGGSAPLHLPGPADPRELFVAVEAGVDVFGSAAPGLAGRAGTVYTVDGLLDVTDPRRRTDYRPLDVESVNYVSQYTRAYIHHLFTAREGLAAALCTIHNEQFLVWLLAQIREAVIEGRYPEFKREFLARFTTGAAWESEPTRD